ncbi:predicted protein [Aspergillus terreus NIH2624]|uniref:Uncharacterized protein n=1 Tax=Aspergillus terreus (strain NIH 2624 / FGSC A1156) TaxID=341663 RepID=Q0CZJ9_ASPTN|nr:uncharacterized protein ATEG_00885 [Aspergillus terreus NIH2624]EAU39531.1 predicted protein [Aspergillus terreus NIH2624]
MCSQPYLDVANAARPGSQSSAEHSIYSDIPPTTHSSRLFHVYHRRRKLDFAITTDEKAPLAYVRCSTFTIGKPDLTYHAGETEDAPITAVCKFINFSRHCKVGLGNPEDPNTVWEDLMRHKLTTHYRFEITLQTGERRAFVWKRTNSVGIGEETPSKIGAKNFKLQDELTEELVAVYLNNGAKSWKKSGKFQINVHYGPVFDTMVFITGLGLLEKERRRERSRQASGGECIELAVLLRINYAIDLEDPRPLLRAIIFDCSSIDDVDVTAVQGLIDVRNVLNKHTYPEVAEWHFVNLSDSWARRGFAAAGFGYPCDNQKDNWEPIFSVAAIKTADGSLPKGCEDEESHGKIDTITALGSKEMAAQEKLVAI